MPIHSSGTVRIPIYWLLVVPLFLSLPLEAATITVTTLSDVVDTNDAVVSLREALGTANTAPDADIINFDNSLTGSMSINPVNGPLFLRSAGTIDGDNRITIDGGGLGSLLTIDDQVAGATVDVTLLNLTLQNSDPGMVAVDSRENLTVRGSTVQNNGVGINMINAGSLTIDSSMIRNNALAGAQGFDVDVDNSTFMGNVRTIDSTPGPALVASSGTVDDSSFDNNDIGLKISSTSQATLSLRNLMVRNNKSGLQVNTNVAVIISDSTFSGNNADNVVGNVSGAAILVSGQGSSLTVSNSNFLNNTAGLNSGMGGAISVSGIAGQTIIRASTFSGNRAAQCGAISAGLGLIENQTVIETNQAMATPGQGGGACGQLTLINTIVRNNQTQSGDGGGLVLGHPSLVRDSVIHNNIAAGNGNGGGIAYTSLIQGADDSFIINSTISNNTAALGGGGIWVDRAPTNGRLQMINSTIVQNTSNGGNGGGGLLFRIPSPFQPTLVRNTIIAKNLYTGPFPTLFGQDILSDSPAGLNLDGNNLLGDTVVGLIGFPARPSNLENVDPLLDALANNGGFTNTHSLANGSPALDAGDNAFALDDQGITLVFDQRGAGFARIQFGGVEIGAYESNLPPLTGALTLSAGPGNGPITDPFAGTQDVVAMHVKLTVAPADGVIINNATFRVSGDGNDLTGISAVKLYVDEDGDGAIDPSEPRIGGPGTFHADNGQVSFALARSIPAGQMEFWILAFDLSQSACLCQDFKPSLSPGDVAVTLQAGGGAVVSGVVDGRFVEMAGGSLSIVSGNNQNNLVGQPLSNDMVVQSLNQFPACGPVEFSIEQNPGGSGGKFSNNKNKIEVTLDVNNQARTGFTFGDKGGAYKIRTKYNTTRPPDCTTQPDFVDFDHAVVGLKLTDSLTSFRQNENLLRTFVQTIGAQNEYTLELDPPGLPGFSLDRVSFDLAGQSSVDATTPFQATIDMQNVLVADNLMVDATITVPSLGSLSLPRSFPVQAIGIPGWFSVIETIAGGVTTNFEVPTRTYKIGFDYPSDFVWTESVDSVVALLGGAGSDLGLGGFKFSSEATYDIDSNSSLSAGIERDVKIFDRVFTVFGEVSAGFDPNFEFNTPGTPVGTLGASTSLELPEKSFARTVVVYGVPVTAGLDLGGVAQMTLTGRIYLDPDLRFSQLLISPEPSIQLDVVASLSALFGLAKAVATASPTATAQIHLPYSTLNGLQFPRFGGRLEVELAIEASLFYGLASAEVGSASLGPYNWGNFIAPKLNQRWALLQAGKGSSKALILTPPSFIQTHAVAGDASGRAMLLYNKNVGVTSPDPEIYFEFDDGSGFAAPAPLRGTSVPDSRWEMDPAVTFMGGGDAMALWTVNNGAQSLNNLGDILNQQEIAWSLWNNTSQSWTTPTDLTSDLLPDGLADIAYDAANNTVVGVWVHDSDGTNTPTVRSDWEIHSSVYNASSGTWSTVAITNDTAADYMPSVASRGGVTMAVWSEDADGELFVDPGLASGEDGTIIDGSNLDTSNADASLVFATFNGTNWSVKQTLFSSVSTASFTQMADVAGFASNRFIAVWVDKQSTHDELYYSTYDGSVWGTPVMVAASDQFIENPSVTVDGANQATIVYRAYDSTTGDGDGYAGNLMSQGVDLSPVTVVAAAKAPNALNASTNLQAFTTPLALTDDTATQMFATTATSGGAIRVAWFDHGGTGGIVVLNGTTNGSTLSPGCTVATVDLDLDGLFDQLNLGLDLTIASAGNYALSGDLFDKHNQFVAHAQSASTALGIGAQSLALSFLGASISGHDIAGTYSLKNVALLIANPSPLVVDQLANVCTTLALQPNDFDAAALRFNQAEYNSLDVAEITLEFAAANADNLAIDTASVRVWSNLDTTGIKVDLNETGNNTGVFSGGVTFDPVASNTITDRVQAPGGAGVITRFDDPGSATIFLAQALIKNSTPGPQAAFSDVLAPDPMSLLAVAEGDTDPTGTLTVTNSGHAGTTLTGTCSYAGDTQISIINGVFSLGQGLSQIATVSCDAIAQGSYSGNISCTHDAANVVSPVIHAVTCAVGPPGPTVLVKPVPTVSTWGWLIALILTMMGLGGIVIRRNRIF